MDRLYTSAVERIELPEVAEEMLDRVREHAIERAVAGLERMWMGLCDTTHAPSGTVGKG